MTGFFEKECQDCKSVFDQSTMICPHDGSVLATTIASTPSGHRLSNRYEIVDEIGRGGMGVIYSGVDLQEQDPQKRKVAIKLLISDAAQNPVMRNRFINEARAASAMSHPNIVGVREYNVTDDGLAFIVMDYLEGLPLSELIDAGALTHETILPLLIQVCDALAHAHRRDVIHRDIKPSNIMIVGTGEDLKAVLVDFGIAKIFTQPGQISMRLTQTGQVFGSPLYMSPEQCMGQKLDRRSDIYSMGCLLYEYAAGRMPFEGDSFIQIIFAHINQAAEPFAKDDFTTVLQSVIMKAIEKQPDDRFESMDELRDQLSYCLALLTREDVDNFDDYLSLVAPKQIQETMINYDLLASEGDVDAQMELVYLYSEDNENYNPELAFEWCLKAATAGHSHAQAYLGDFFRLGTGTQIDLNMAFFWYSKSALQNHPGAERWIGMMYLDGLAVEANQETALYWLRRSCQHDDIDSQIYLAQLLVEGESLPQDLPEAFKWYQAAAELGSAAAQVELALCYKEGLGVASDMRMAFDWLSYAAEQGSARAQKLLSQYYEEGTGVAPDKALAYKWMKEAADQGDGEALTFLGWWYSQGLNRLPRDEKRAVKLFKEAAEQNHAEAMYYLSHHYQNGYGVPQSTEASTYWLKKGAEGGSHQALYELACRLKQGKIIKKDLVEAKEKLEQAATAGSAQAMYDLALVLKVEGDDDLSKQWLDVARDEGITAPGPYFE